MPPVDAQTVLNTAEILKIVKSLASNSNPYIPFYSALGGAFIGALASLIPAFVNDWRKDRKETKSTALQIYAEISAGLAIVEQRRYIEDLEKILAAFRSGAVSDYMYVVQVPEDMFPIYKNAIPKLGLLDPMLQMKIVKFHRFADAIIQDIKPGGMLNAEPSGEAAFADLLDIFRLTVKEGSEILATVEKRYPECAKKDQRPQIENI